MSSSTIYSLHYFNGRGRAEAIRLIFTQAGQVASAKIIMDRSSGRSKGFGFVEMASENDAQNAIAQFNGAHLNGRALTVNEARPQAPSGNSNRSFNQMGRSERPNRW